MHKTVKDAAAHGENVSSSRPPATPTPPAQNAAHAYIVLTTTRRAPLFARPRLRRLAAQALEARCAAAPGRLWAYAVTTCTVRLVVGPTEPAALDAFVFQLKGWVAAPVLCAIQRADDETLDAVLHYNPVWGGALYRLWENGHHCQWLWSAYHLSQALYALGTWREKGATVWFART